MMMADVAGKNESQEVIDRERLVDLLVWVAAHPCVADMDEASERILNTLDNLAGQVYAPAIEAQSIEAIADLLNRLLDTIGNCEIEETNLKTALWSEIVLRADAARNILQADR